MPRAGISASRRPVPTPIVHRCSHRELVPRVAGPSPGWPGRFDAVIVPASREVHNLGFAGRLAVACGWPLVVLCSGRVGAEEAVCWLRSQRGTSDVVALDVHADLVSDWTRFSIEDHPEAGGDGYADRARKRNLALVVSRLAGWRRVLFLDDDMSGIDRERVRRAAGLLRSHRPTFRAVGWVAEDYPDNSVVCHAHRSVGAWQDTFVGAHSLGIDLQAPLPFFPPVYNEDWLFLHDWLADGAVALGGRIRQTVYNPFADPQRAAWEEFGDVLGEGLFEALHLGLDVGSSFSAAYWSPVVAARVRLLDQIGGRLDAGDLSSMPDPERWDEVRASVAAARARLEELSPETFADFVVAWRADLLAWQRNQARLPRVGSVQAALGWLGVNWVSSRD